MCSGTQVHTSLVRQWRGTMGDICVMAHLLNQDSTMTCTWKGGRIYVNFIIRLEIKFWLFSPGSLMLSEFVGDSCLKWI